MNEGSKFEIKKRKIDVDFIPPKDKSLQAGFKELKDIVEKYNIAEMVSEKTGLEWKISPIKIEHTDGGADWKGLDTVLEDYHRGVWGVSSMAHEMLHLILRQNNWLENEEIKKFIADHPELKNQKRGDGYPIEQMIAYLLQNDVNREIGEKEKIKSLILGWEKDQFEKILEQEYDSQWLKKLGKLIIERWKPEEKNIINWIKSIIIEIEREAN